MAIWPIFDDEFESGSTDTFLYLTYYPSRVEFDCFLKHIPSPVEQTSLQGQFHWIWQFLTIVWLRLLISYVPSKTDCNYGTPVEGSINKKAQNSEQLRVSTWDPGTQLGLKMVEIFGLKWTLFLFNFYFLELQFFLSHLVLLLLFLELLKNSSENSFVFVSTKPNFFY